MNDKARECAEELIAGIVTALRKTGNLVEGAEIEPAIKAAQNIIAKHFPAEPMVAVSKLEHLLRNSETFGWRTANWVAAIRGLIAEAK